MSRSNPNDRPINPAQRFMQWSSDNKCFSYYDKEAPHPTDSTKKGANILIPLPFSFLVLDELVTIKGFSDSDQSGFWSNEIRDIKKETLSVRSKKGLETEGLYDDIKGKLTGAKYTKSVYVGFHIKKGELVIGNINFVGAALSAWIEFVNNNKNIQNDGAVKVEGVTEEKKGKTIYYKPIFKKITVSDAANQEALKLDQQLQEYFKKYFSRAPESTPTAEQVEATFNKDIYKVSETPNEDPLFNSRPIDDDLPF